MTAEPPPPAAERRGMERDPAAMARYLIAQRGTEGAWREARRRYQRARFGLRVEWFWLDVLEALGQIQHPHVTIQWVVGEEPE